MLLAWLYCEDHHHKSELFGEPILTYSSEMILVSDLSLSYSYAVPNNPFSSLECGISTANVTSPTQCRLLTPCWVQSERIYDCDLGLFLAMASLIRTAFDRSLAVARAHCSDPISTLAPLLTASGTQRKADLDATFRHAMALTLYQLNLAPYALKAKTLVLGFNARQLSIPYYGAMSPKVWVSVLPRDMIVQ